MVLAVDIGNTNISFGLIGPKGRVFKNFVLPTSRYRLSQVKAKLKGLRASDAVICSVVPRLTGRLAVDLKGFLKGRVLIAGRDMKVPIKNLYKYPRQVGQDRLVNAYAALRLYGAPVICIDYGTAITFDAVSARGQYLGGLILPGLRISLEALHKNTALLPRVELAAPRELIGTETRQSMLAGAVFGAACVTDEIVRRLKHLIGKKALVIATGGNIGLIARFSGEIDKVERFLTLKGLGFIFGLKQP